MRGRQFICVSTLGSRYHNPPCRESSGGGAACPAEKKRTRRGIEVPLGDAATFLTRMQEGSIESMAHSQESQPGVLRQNLCAREPAEKRIAASVENHAKESLLISRRLRSNAACSSSRIGDLGHGARMVGLQTIWSSSRGASSAPDRMKVSGGGWRTVGRQNAKQGDPPDGSRTYCTIRLNCNIIYHTILYYTLYYTIHYTLYTIHNTLYKIHNTLYTIHYTQYRIHYTEYTIHNTLYYTLYTIYYILHTIYHTIYYTLYTTHYAARERGRERATA